MFSATVFESVWVNLFVVISVSNTVKCAHKNGDLSLWIDEQQVKMFSGFSMEIYAIVDGNVLPYILDPKFEQYLPIIPSEVAYVNFTWKSGVKKYNYHFDYLQSFDETILEPPVISIKTKGRVPRRPKVFSVFLPCSGNNSGIASFGIGLQIETRKGRALPGMPLRLRLRKECVQRGPDPECDKRCANGGWCNHEKICQCPEGYMGQYCKTALCYPQCMNGGSCTSPGVCSCPIGFQGRHCEGGICAEKCLNGGKCIQKDTCECPKGYYGLRCEFSKCVVPCLNGGRCRGVNKCRCPVGFRGDHCEIGRRIPQRSLCSKPCHHGTCQADSTCLCDDGWFGRLCHQKHIGSNSSQQRSLVLMGVKRDEDGAAMELYDSQIGNTLRKTHWPTAVCTTFSICTNADITPLGSEPCLPWWEGSGTDHSRTSGSQYCPSRLQRSDFDWQNNQPCNGVTTNDAVFSACDQQNILIMGTTPVTINWMSEHHDTQVEKKVWPAWCDMTCSMLLTLVP